ncbi:MAG: cyclic nucleotide-binding domain-containing protein [Ketobacteraceae bacterium]|nr:cyclic nucleotide-binding domain-containing protein [Ketobacteraceae bacterium]
MFIESNFTEEFEAIDNRCKELCERLLEQAEPAGEVVSYELIEDLYAFETNQNLVFVVEEGALGQEQNNSTLFFFDQGDLVGLDQTQEMPRGRFFAEAPVKLRPYRRDVLLNHLISTPELCQLFVKYLINEASRRTTIISMVGQGVDKASLGFAHFSAGDVIIEEGTDSDTVYSIVEGHAEVTVKGMKVGEVLEDEIFGALSLLTNSRRTATVTATKNCMVLVVPQEQFETLLQTHPKICMSLMENMARQIVSLNEKLTAASQ